MEEKIMIDILDKFIWYGERNRLFEATRYIAQEINNLKGISEQKCKRLKNLREKACIRCPNYNCNLNHNIKVLDKSDKLTILNEIRTAFNTNNKETISQKLNEYIKIIKEKNMLKILECMDSLVKADNISIASEYLTVEIDNLIGITPKKCKVINIYSGDLYCNTCSNENCPDKK